ncbi:MAG: hypothetical protein K8S56_04365 [Candidatus Cloacimonetes bacterium]|nr:hypothetical protein [Candidatus Cloacimonadota bacterium]
MRKLVIILFIVVAVSVLTGQTPIANIQDSISFYDGQTVTVEGVITIGAGTIHSSILKAYIQDESGKGIQLFDFTLTTTHIAEIVRGNRFNVTGEVEEYQGTTEIKNISYNILETGLDIAPYITVMSLNQAADYVTWEGTLVSVSGTLNEDPYTSGGGTNLNITDSSGDDLTVRVWESTGIDYSSLANGDAITAIGAIGVYESAAQVLPGYPEDLDIKLPDEPEISNISHSPADPEEDDPITVTATITDAARDITSATLEYRAESQTVYFQTAMQANGNEYSATTPAISSLVTTSENMVVRIRATDNDNNETVSYPITIVIGGGSFYTAIADIQANLDYWNGQLVEVKAVVTIGAGVLRVDQLSAYIQDLSGAGINLYGGNMTSQYENDIIRNNVLIITGTIEEYDGTTEIKDFSYQIVEEPSMTVESVIVPLTLAEAADWENLEGAMVKVEGTVTDIGYAGGGANITIADNNSEEITLRIWDSTEIDTQNMSVGNFLRVGGVIGSYNDASQILSGYDEDIYNFNKIAGWRISSQPDILFAADTLKVTVDFTPGYLAQPDGFPIIVSAQVFYALETETSWWCNSLVIDTNYVYKGEVSPLNSVTNEENNYKYYIQAINSNNSIIQSDIIYEQVYSGKPIVSNVVWLSDAMTAYPIPGGIVIPHPFIDEYINITASITDPNPNGSVEEAKLLFRRFNGSTEHDTLMTRINNIYWESWLPPMDSLATFADTYQFSLHAIDDDSNERYTEWQDILTGQRAPVVFNLQIENIAERGVSLIVGANILDTDGYIVSALLKIQTDYSSGSTTIAMSRDTTYTSTYAYVDSTRWQAVIPGQSGGTDLIISVYAEDNSGYTTLDYPGNGEIGVSYTYPVISHTAI